MRRPPVDSASTIHLHEPWLTIVTGPKLIDSEKSMFDASVAVVARSGTSMIVDPLDRRKLAGHVLQPRS